MPDEPTTPEPNVPPLAPAPEAAVPTGESASEPSISPQATTAVAEPKPSRKHWYVVKVQSGREESIKEAIERRVKIEGLEEYFGQIIIPVERVTEMRNNKRVVKERNDPARYDWKPKVYLKRDADGYRLPTLSEYLAAPKSSTGRQWEFVWDLAGEVYDPAAHPAHAAYGGGNVALNAGAAALYVSPGGASPLIGLRVTRGPVASLDAPAPNEIPRWNVVEPARQPPPKQSLFAPGALAKIANGTYLRSDEATVTITDFHITKTEISFADWRKVYQWSLGAGYDFDHDGDMGSMDWDTTSHNHSPAEPVTDIGWWDAVVWCNALSEMEGKTPVYYEDTAKTKVLRKAFPWRIRMVDETQGLAPAPDPDIFTRWEADGYRLSTWAVHKIRARVQDVLGKYRHRNREMSLEEPLLGGRNNEEDALTLGEVLESQVPGPDEAFEKKKAQHFLGQVFGDLTPYLLSASPRQVSRMLRLSGYSPQELQRLAEAEGVL